MFKKILQDKETINYLLSKGGITFFFRMIAMAFSFLTMWFINNFYGATIFGRFSVALTVLQITTMVFALGLPYAFISFTGEFSCKSKIKGFLFKNIKIALFSALIPAIVYFVFAEQIANYFFNKSSLIPYFIILALSIPFLIFHEIICYYFMSVKKFITYGIILFIAPNVIFIFFLILFKELNSESYFTFFAYSLSMATTSIIGFLVVFFNKSVVERTSITTKTILNKSLPMMMSGIFLVLLNWTDILMLGRFQTESQIGVYNVAFKLGSLTLFFVVSMNVVITPKVSELFYKNDFILSFFGTVSVSGKTTLILITLGALFNAMTGNVDQILNMTNNQKRVRNIFLIGFILNVILNLILIPIYGIVGAATSSLITNVIVNSIFVLIIKKKLGFYTFM